MYNVDDTVTCDDDDSYDEMSVSNGECMSYDDSWYNYSEIFTVECDGELLASDSDSDSESTGDPEGNGAGVLSVAVAMLLSVAATFM